MVLLDGSVVVVIVIVVLFACVFFFFPFSFEAFGAYGPKTGKQKHMEPAPSLPCNSTVSTLIHTVSALSCDKIHVRLHKNWFGRRK